MLCHWVVALRREHEARGDAVDLIEQDDGRGELLRAFEDSPDGGLGFADPFGEQCRAVHDLDMCTALSGHGTCEKNFSGARRAGEDDAVAKGFGTNAEEDIGVLEWEPPRVALV